MAIVRIPYGNALPTEQNDYVKQNNLIKTGFLQVNKPIWEDAANNIVQGAVFQVGGTVYHCNAATAIGGVASDYIKLTPSGDGSTLAADYVADLTGVTWNSTYNGYYDVSGNAYVFDEIDAYRDGEISILNTKLFSAILEMQGRRKGAMELVLTEYNTTTVPKVAAGSGIEINGQWYYTDIDITISGATANSTWYDILLTPSGGTFTASFVARETGVWSDSLHGLYSSTNRVIGCVYKNASAEFINKNILKVDNRTIKLKIDIGDWDMDTTANLNVPHGITATTIREVFVLINKNGDGARYPITWVSNQVPQGIWFSDDATNISLFRYTPGFFDDSDFSGIVYERGWITITYEV